MTPQPRHARERRYGWGAVIGVGVAGLVLGILAANLMAVWIVGGGK